MNKKLIVAAMVMALSITAANASNISGFSQTSGTFNINPLKANGTVGYRYYDDFVLDQNDIANLIFKMQSGDQRAVDTFINLVGGSNKAQILGILNSVDENGAFKNGHTVFMTKNGLTVGQNGVLNVGTLSVLSPKFSGKTAAQSFDKLVTDYNNGDFTTINNINHMRNNTDASSNPNNYGANSPVEINGLVLTRSGADIRGSSVDIGANAKIVNGYNGNDVFTTKSVADTLFNSLVNADGIQAASALINNDGSRIVIKSGAGTNGINIKGQVANLNNTEMAISNHGTNGLTIDGGLVASKGQLNLYNNIANENSVLTLKNGAKAIGASVLASSEGAMDVQAGTTLKANNKVEIVNENGKLKFAGTALGNRIDVRNAGANGMDITGTFGTSDNKATSVRFSNEAGALNFAGQVNATNSASFYGQDTAAGMSIGGTVNAGQGIRVENRAGNLALNGNMTVTNGDLAVVNKGAGNLTSDGASVLTVNQGRMIIRNKATGNMELAGTIKNYNGVTSIYNDVNAGSMTVGGTITNKGNIGLTNKGKGTMTVSANVTNTNGTTKIMNYANGTSAQGMLISGTVTNTGAAASDRLYVYNGKGSLQLSGTLENKTKGDVFITNRDKATHIYTAGGSNIKNSGGNIAIVNRGTNSDTLGLELYGNVQNTKSGGEISINNYNGGLLIGGGTINANGNIGIINRGANTIENNGHRTGTGTSVSIGSDAEITSTGNHTINIKNNGTGNMEVDGTINHDGRLNVLANKGSLTLNGTVNNTGTDMSYFAARKNGTGIVVNNDFKGNTTNGGTILIKNITGTNGLTYAGQMNSENGGQIEVYNMVGDLTVTGDAKMTGGAPTVILNKGENMTVSNDATLTGDLKIVNKGGKAAIVGNNYKQYLKEQLKN